MKYVTGRLRLRSYLHSPGDGRKSSQIPAQALLWALLVGQLLRQHTYRAVEALVRSPARRALGVGRSFGDDALGYFTERLDPRVTRLALAQTMGRAKRNKAFDDCRFIGLIIDGTTVGRRSPHRPTCRQCRPRRDQHRKVLYYRHHLVMISVTGAGLSLPFDVEPYGPGDSERAAAQRLLRRAVRHLGARFADYAVVDGEFANAPFIHVASELGLRVVIRLKANLPELFGAAQRRFASHPPHHVFYHHGDRVEIWDADDFDPWEGLRWTTVRVFRYRQHKPDGQVFEAFWLTDFPKNHVGSASLFRMAKARWEIENQGFNDAKTRHGLEHICHHHPRSLLVGWLLTCLALTIERLYRLRYLHRGMHAIRTAIDLVRRLWLSLSRTCPLIDSS